MIAHEKIEVVNDPRAEPYSRFTLKLDSDAVAFMQESVNIIGFMSTGISTADTSDEKHKVATATPTRRLYMDETSLAYTGKRHAPGLPKHIELPSAKEGMLNFTTAWNNRK
jgi:hypothetical protein